jgi:hypothetical protein
VLNRVDKQITSSAMCDVLFFLIVDCQIADS